MSARKGALVPEVVQPVVKRGLLRKAAGTFDLTAAVRDVASAARDYAEVREREHTRRAAIASAERVELARIAAQRDLVLGALERAFDERAVAFRNLFEALDTALQDSDPTKVAAVTGAITQLAAANPFVALRDVAAVQAAAANPNHVWEI